MQPPTADARRSRYIGLDASVDGCSSLEAGDGLTKGPAGFRTCACSLAIARCVGCCDCPGPGRHYLSHVAIQACVRLGLPCSGSCSRTSCQTGMASAGKCLGRMRCHSGYFLVDKRVTAGVRTGPSFTRRLAWEGYGIPAPTVWLTVCSGQLGLRTAPVHRASWICRLQQLGTYWHPCTEATVALPPRARGLSWGSRGTLVALWRIGLRATCSVNVCEWRSGPLHSPRNALL